MGRKKGKNESKSNLAEEVEPAKVVKDEEKTKVEDSEIVKSESKEKPLQTDKNSLEIKADKQEIFPEKEEILVKDEKSQGIEGEFSDVYEVSLDKVEGKVEAHEIKTEQKTEVFSEKIIDKLEAGEEIQEKNEAEIEKKQKEIEKTQETDVLVENKEENEKILEEKSIPDVETEKEKDLAKESENKAEEEETEKNLEENSLKTEKKDENSLQTEKKDEFVEEKPSTDEKTDGVVNEKPLVTEEDPVFDGKNSENPDIEEHKEKIDSIDVPESSEELKFDSKPLETEEFHKNPEENTENKPIISDSSENPNTKSYSTEFSISYQTAFGEKIVLVGSSSELGNWEPEKGFELKWEPNHVWKGVFSYDVLPFEYKYVLVGNEATLWEKGINRKISEYLPSVVDEWQPI